MNPIDFKWMSERQKEPQLLNMQENIDLLIDLGYTVRGLSNEDIEELVEELIASAEHEGQWH